jgi:hypothetical protein
MVLSLSELNRLLPKSLYGKQGVVLKENTAGRDKRRL